MNVRDTPSDLQLDQIFFNQFDEGIQIYSYETYVCDGFVEINRSRSNDEGIWKEITGLQI
ncbi:unnamed protein product [Paramecium octaurelia]|uniref:Uncharacterized protein n=1 Tax=Paramecium octaurelia TaxID=43137 RepID=A0A8S1T8W9_PAROT|nr:unnamed protein product [Paramecium octaurelia]